MTGGVSMPKHDMDRYDCPEYAVREVARILLGLIEQLRLMATGGSVDTTRVKVGYYLGHTGESMESDGWFTLISEECRAPGSLKPSFVLDLDDSDLASKVRYNAIAVCQQSEAGWRNNNRSLDGVGLQFAVEGNIQALFHKCRWNAQSGFLDWSI